MRKSAPIESNRYGRSYSPVSLSDIIDRHVQRDFGQTGFREITLDVFNNDEIVFSYRILHVWMLQEGACSSIYFLIHPPVLTGTAVKVVERPRESNMEIWLRLRNAKQPIRVASERSDQLVLGTDFSYEDLRFWLPTDAFDITEFEITGESGSEECVLQANRRARGVDTHMRLILDARRWLPITIERRGTAGGVPLRIYSARHLVCDNGVWTPQVISVDRPREYYKSVMTLRRALHKVPIEPGLFQTHNLTELSLSAFDGYVRSAPEFRVPQS